MVKLGGKGSPILVEYEVEALSFDEDGWLTWMVKGILFKTTFENGGGFSIINRGRLELLSFDGWEGWLRSAFSCEGSIREGDGGCSSESKSIRRVWTAILLTASVTFRWSAAAARGWGIWAALF